MSGRWGPMQVRRLRDELGMDEPGFAKLLGVDVRTVRRWESGLAYLLVKLLDLVRT